MIRCANFPINLIKVYGEEYEIEKCFDNILRDTTIKFQS